MFIRQATVITALSSLIAISGFAQTNPEATAPETTPAPNDDSNDDGIETITITGEKEEERSQLPGAAHRINNEMLKRHDFGDIGATLQSVPGVYSRTEDGNGMLPNISIRGVDPSRSSKVSLMEDGILMSPAPYSAPAAYYSPNLGRMRSLEILKGSSQIKYGPHITGGAINYVSTPVPIEPKIFAKGYLGSFKEQRSHIIFGDGYSTESGDFGVLLEGYQQSYEGFKRIDPLAGDIADPQDATNRDAIAKVMWESATAPAQRIELMVGQTQRRAELSYLGLSDADFNATPLRLYNATMFDRLETEQRRAVARYRLSLGAGSVLNVSAYKTSFTRSWYKIDSVIDFDADGDGILDGEGMGLPGALAGAAGGRALGVLRGENTGILQIGDNQRDFYTRGVNVQPTWIISGDTIEHRIELGIRYHQDGAKRNQRKDTVERAADGSFNDLRDDDTWYEIGADGSGGHRRQDAEALAIYLQDTLSIGRWSIVPGIRFETISMSYEDFNTPDDKGEDEIELFGGGLGGSYTSENDWRMFGGVYRGFSPPSPRAVIKSNLQPEYSTSVELGGEVQRSRIRLGLTLFHTILEDLIVIDNIGGSGTGESQNAGEVTTSGVEWSSDTELGDLIFSNGYSVPLFLTATYTDARISSAANSLDGESMFAGAKDGNRVPYVPDIQLSAGTGFGVGKFISHIQYRYQAATFATANNNTEQVDVLGNPDARYGKVPAQTFVDASVKYETVFGGELSAGITNLLNKTPMVSRHPFGPRPAKPRSGYVSVSASL